MKDALIWNDRFRVYRSFRQVYMIKSYREVYDHRGKVIMVGNAPQKSWQNLAVLDRDEKEYSLKFCQNTDRFLLKDLRQVNEILGFELFDEQTIQKLEGELVLERLMRKK